MITVADKGPGEDPKHEDPTPNDNFDDDDVPTTNLDDTDPTDTNNSANEDFDNDETPTTSLDDNDPSDDEDFGDDTPTTNLPLTGDLAFSLLCLTSGAVLTLGGLSLKRKEEDEE